MNEAISFSGKQKNEFKFENVETDTDRSRKGKTLIFFLSSRMKFVRAIKRESENIEKKLYSQKQKAKKVNLCLFITDNWHQTQRIQSTRMLDSMVSCEVRYTNSKQKSNDHQCKNHHHHRYHQNRV